MRTILAIALALATLPTIPLAAADHTSFLTGADVATQYADPVTFSARLAEPNSDCPLGSCPLTSRQVDFYVDGAYVGTDVTNSGGFAYLRIDDTSAWHVGLHSVRAQYDRSAGGAATITTKLTVSQETTVLVAREGYFQARLTDDDANPLAGADVRFSYVSPAGEQNVCHAYTDADGVASCVPLTGAGLNVVNAAEASYKATFDGTSDFVASTDNGALI